MNTVYHSRLFSFYRNQAIRADFSGGQITSDAGLLPLRALISGMASIAGWQSVSVMIATIHV
jgi:hypothetical protein